MIKYINMQCGGIYIMAKTDEEILENYKARIRRQNKAISENYDKVTATLPKGTVDRIKALGLTINGVINDSVLSFLERMEEEPPQETDAGEDNTETAPKNQIMEESVLPQEKSQGKPINGGKTEAEKLAELQALIDAKRAEEVERKRQIEERKARAEKERQEEFRSMVNSVADSLKAQKEQRREEDKKKFRQMTDNDILELLQDIPFSEWLEKAGFENALIPLSEEIGINNAERVINAAKERRRSESIKKSGCPF